MPQPPGWQCLLHAALLHGDVISLALAARPRVLAAGDARGHVVVLDLAKVCASIVADECRLIPCVAEGMRIRVLGCITRGVGRCNGIGRAAASCAPASALFSRLTGSAADCCSG